MKFFVSNRQAEVEQKRCNISLSHDMLRRIIDSCIARRDCKGGETNLETDEADLGKEINRQFHLHISFPTFPNHLSVGGTAQLVHIEFRAHLALVSPD